MSRFNIEIKDLSQEFSFSRLLARNDQDEYNEAENVNVMHNGKQLDAVHTVALGLNEEARKLCRGCFYHLPLRQDIVYGHPCDMVFADEEWNEFDCEFWDAANWEERLSLHKADKTILAPKRVIPVCVRVLSNEGGTKKFHPAKSTKTASAEPKNGPQTSQVEDSSTEYQSSQSSAEQSSTKTSRSTVSSDPAIKLDNFAYSRPIEDISSMLILFDNQGSLPFVCRTTAFEHKSICLRFPTPGDMSETFVPTNFKADIADTAGHDQVSEAASRALNLVLKGLEIQSMKDVVQTLLTASQDIRTAAERDNWLFGPLKYLWSEVEDRIDTDSELRDVSKIDFWPKTWPAEVELYECLLSICEQGRVLD